MTVRKTAPASASSTPATPKSKATEGAAYRIVPGDTLSAIALAAYGNASWWPAIKAANEKKVGKKELILAGDTLRLPTKEEARTLMAQLASAKKAAKPGWQQKPVAGRTPGAGGAQSSTASPAPREVGAARAQTPARPPVTGAAPPGVARSDTGAPAPAGAAAAAPVAAATEPAQPPELTEAPDLDSGLMKPKAGTTPRALAAAAFGIRPEDVSALHTNTLREVNPDLDLSNLDAPLSTDAVVNVVGTPQLVRLQVADITFQRGRMQQVLDEDKAAAPGTEKKLDEKNRAELEQLLGVANEQLGVLGDQLKNVDYVAAFGVAAGKFEKETGAEAIKKAYGPWLERAEKELPGKVNWVRNTQFNAHQVAANQLLKADPPAALANVAAAKEVVTKLIDSPTLSPLSKANFQTGRASLAVMEAAFQSASKALHDYRSTKPASVSSERPLPAAIVGAVKEAKANIEKLTASADSDLKVAAEALGQAAAATQDQTLKTRLEAERARIQDNRARLPFTALQAEAQIHVATNDAVQMLTTIESELKLQLGVDPKVELLKPTLTQKIDSDNDKAWFFGTEVHTLSPAQLKVITDKLAALPAAGRIEALSIVARYAETAAAGKSHSAVSVGAQVLRAESKADPTWELEAKLAEAGQLMTVGALDKARDVYIAVRKAVDAQLPTENEPPERSKARTRAVTGEVLAYSRLSQEGDTSANGGLTIREDAGWKLSALRTELEKEAAVKTNPRALAPEALARITVSEIEAFLNSGQARKAEAALKHLKATYGELPTIKTAIDELEKAYRQGGAAAFFKTLGAQGLAMSGTDMLKWAGAGAVVSTILAFTAAGTVMPGPGNVIGFVAGSIAALGGAAFGVGALSVATTAASGFKAWEAGQTGLTSVSTTEAVLGAGATASSVIGMGTPFRMITKVGGLQGVRASVLGAQGGDDIVRVLEARAALLEAAKPGIFNGASAEARLLGAQQALTHEALHGGLMFGAKAQSVAVAMQVSHMMKQWYDVSNSKAPDEEKARQLSMVHQQLATLGAQVGILGGAIGLLTKGVYRGTPDQIRTALRDRVVQPNVYNRVLEPGQSHDFEFVAPLRKLDISGVEVVSAAKAGDNVHLTAGEVGTATVKLKAEAKGSKTVKINVTVRPSTAEMELISEVYGFGTEYVAKSIKGADLKLLAMHARAYMPEVERLRTTAVDDPPKGVPSKSDWERLEKAMLKKIAEAPAGD